MGEVRNVILLTVTVRADSRSRWHATMPKVPRLFHGIDAPPFTGQYTHWLDRETGKPNYVTGHSAASANGMGAGVKSC